MDSASRPKKGTTKKKKPKVKFTFSDVDSSSDDGPSNDIRVAPTPAQTFAESLGSRQDDATEVGSAESNLPQLDNGSLSPSSLASSHPVSRNDDPLCDVTASMRKLKLDKKVKNKKSKKKVPLFTFSDISSSGSDDDLPDANSRETSSGLSPEITVTRAKNPDGERKANAASTKPAENNASAKSGAPISTAYDEVGKASKSHSNDSHASSGTTSEAFSCVSSKLVDNEAIESSGNGDDEEEKDGSEEEVNEEEGERRLEDEVFDDDEPVVARRKTFRLILSSEEDEDDLDNAKAIEYRR